MYNSACYPIPTLIASNINVVGASAKITVRGNLPTKGRFNLRFCGPCVPCCSAADTVEITDGTTVLTPVLTRCGNNLSLNALDQQIRRFCVAHFCISNDTPNLTLLLDKICCSPTIYTDDSVAIRVTGTESGDLRTTASPEKKRN